MSKRKRGILISVCVVLAILAGYMVYVRIHSGIDDEVLQRVARHNEDISIYVDFGINSAQPRFFVYDNKNRKLLVSSKCTHGSGRGSTMSKPVFSNEVGSHCSSLGEYKLTNNSRLNTANMPCIRIQGLNHTNSNVAQRGVVIHEAFFFADDISIGIPIPVTPVICQGCFGISSKAFTLLQNLVNQKKTIYLYAVYNS